MTSSLLRFCTLLLFLTVAIRPAVAHDNADLPADEIPVTKSKSDHISHHQKDDGNGYHQVEVHHEAHDIYPIIADISSTTDVKLAAEGGLDDEEKKRIGSSSLNGNNDGTVSSANSNRTPDFSMEVSQQVRVDLFCIVDPAFCERVAESLKDAAMRFNEVVNVKNDLVIQATYYSFCDKGCANDTFAWGAPSSQFTLPFEDGADLNYIYPQALAKQLAPYSNTSAWANHDIAIELNHDMYMNSINYDKAYSDGWNNTGVPPGGLYYFQNDTITAEQVDLRYIILHEILHGLGFVSSWAAYFANEASPFRSLIQGIIDPDELQLVTPSPYWFIKQQTGPIFVTGFQPTMIFDKFLYINNPQSNTSRPESLASIGFDMQNFCVQDNQAFIINFVQEFNRSNQSRTANRLWTSMSEEGTLSFHFPPAAVENSSYITNSYLNQTYTTMKLLTGDQALTSPMELSDRNFRPGISISHLDDSYNATPDFIMTAAYIRGERLEDIVEEAYSNLPAIYYNQTVNGTTTQHVYQSAIGPGVLRMLDSMGYSTVLSNTNYTTTGNVKSGKIPSVCDDKNSNHGIAQASKTPSSSDAAPSLSIIGIADVALCVLALSSVLLI
ncbi:hypothetical protein BJV82DRAFT_606123 [Fennellomyces sp. T-0311]|nr:hypothetical protein BJV82DRAFT_606123 [Fennellomyces sp. T-0311]